MIIVVKKICVGSMFSSRPSNKNICHVISVLGNIDGWLHQNKIFSFKAKKSILARYEYTNSEDSINNPFIKLL